MIVEITKKAEYSSWYDDKIGKCYVVTQRIGGAFTIVRYGHMFTSIDKIVDSGDCEEREGFTERDCEDWDLLCSDIQADISRQLSRLSPEERAEIPELNQS